nr:MAG: ribosome-binding factor A [Propionibacterium sp.]
MTSPRNAKLADLIRTIIAETLERRVKDPRLGFVTITSVRLTKDNREATVFYTVLGDEAERAGSAAALESAKGMLRSAMGAELTMKFIPTLTFVLDATIDSARKIEDLLAQVKAEDEQLAKNREKAQYAGEADPYKTPESDQ